MEQTRRQMARILGSLRPEVLTRVGVHNVRGPLTLEQLLKGAPGTSCTMSSLLRTSGARWAYRLDGAATL